jgi:hypothetical protein
MSNKEEKDQDFLVRYMNPGKVEKAPDGFTGKLMERITAEAPPVKKSIRIFNTLRIPLIAVVTVAGLIIISVLAGQTESELFTAIGERVKNLTAFLPEPGKIIMPEFPVPQIFVYISVGLLVLWLLDMSLNYIFNRSRR